MAEYTDAQIFESFSSCLCPACGNWKKARETVCRKCFGDLPYGLKNNLYLRFGNGYEAAFRRAMECLNQRKEAAAHGPGQNTSRVADRHAG